MLLGSTPVLAQTKVKAVPFAYVPDKTADPYAERVPDKLLPLPDGAFLLLTRRSATEYAVERYQGADLKQLWSCPVTLAEGEMIDAFSTTPDVALLLTYKADAAASSQAIAGYRIDLSTGKAAPRKELMSAPSGRRLYAKTSDDGTKVVTWETRAKGSQIQSLELAVFDQNFKELTRNPVDLRGAGATPSVTVRVSNAGDQYVGMITDGGIKLTVRRYPLQGQQAQVLGVPIGGVFGGKKVYIFDTAYKFDQDNALYAAAICMEEETGAYYSLKAIKFDFAANDMRWAEEFRFSPKFLEETNASATAAGLPGIQSFADSYLSDILLTPEKQVVVVMERKEEEGPQSPHFAKELLLFGYNEFGRPTWHSALWKNQQAPADEGYSGIGYRAHVQGTTLHLVTLEKLGKKTDLYDHAYSALTGKPLPLRHLGLNVSAELPVNYVKDFTTWLDAKTLLAVTLPAKKSKTLMLNRIILK